MILVMRHVQLISQLFFDFFKDDLTELDGYCHDIDENVSNLVYDPLYLITT